MIYFATVHWKRDDWIDVQLSMIKRYVQVPYRTYGYLTGIAHHHHTKFDVIFDVGDPGHARKLDRLAERILLDSESDDDIIIFIDGDAYPIAPIPGQIAVWLEQHQLVAVQRLENLGEKQPHPCFCCTTVGFWKQISGTWAKGYQWINAIGHPETDVGGELLGILKQHNVDWYRLHRSNKVNLNPVFFGIYADLVYHHGAGFRNSASRQIYYDAGLYDVYKRLDAKILNNLVPRKYVRKLRTKLIHPEGRHKRKIHKALRPVITKMFEEIQHNPESVKRLIMKDQSP